MLKQIKLESGDVVVVSSNVVGHVSGWIDSLYRASKNLDKLGILSALILDNDHKIFFHGGFFLPSYNLPLSYAMGEDYLGQYPGTREVETVSLYCALVSKKLVDKLGIPDDLSDDVFSHSNYCLQAIANGFKIYTTDKLAVVYQGGPTDKKEMETFENSFTGSANGFRGRWEGIIKSRYQYPVLYSAKIDAPSGFARAAKGYIRGLHDNNIKVYFEALDQCLESVESTNDEVINALFNERGNMNMPQIIWGQAPYFIKNSGVYKIGHCEFEATEAPESWIPYCNMMDELWVPTNWDREKFRKAGVNVPIYVIHQGIDPAYFHPGYAPMQTDAKEKFKFLVNAAWYPRKNLRNLILAFQSEFRRGEDVCLIIKTIDLGLNKGIKKELDDILSDDNSATVYIKEDNLEDYKLPSLYTMSDCFVFPTRGEAWGLPLFEALACGVPVITTGYGAPFETLTDDENHPLPGVHFVDYTEVEATDPYVYMEGKKWAEPDMVQFSQKMRYVYEHKKEEKAKALETSQFIRDRFSWHTVTIPMIERLDYIYKKVLTKKK